MKLLALSTLFFFGTFGSFKSDDVPHLLDKYIKWTQTGELDLSKIIFDANVDLTYQTEEGDFASTPFDEYLEKIEYAAASVPRSMTVAHFNLIGNKATAYLTDRSREDHFSLVHILNLGRRENQWKIYAIKIIEGS